MTTIIMMGDRYDFYAGDFLVQDPAEATFFTSLPDASAKVSELAKAGVKNPRVRRFHNGEVTNLKD